MIKKFFILPIFFSYYILYSQNIKIITSGGISKNKSSIGSILDKNVFVVSSGIGLDWFEKSNYYISSELNYTQIGGKETNISLPTPYNKMRKKWNFISITSTFRYKIPINNTFFFIGIGPKLNFLLDSSPFKNTIYNNEYKMKKVNFMFNTETGYMHNWQNFRAGIISSYLINITPIASTKFNKLKNNSLLLSLSFGFNF